MNSWKTERHWWLFSFWPRWQFLCLFKPIFYELWLLNIILISVLGSLIILTTLKKYLYLLINTENSLELLIDPIGFSYLPLIMCILRRFLLDPHLCGLRVLVLISNYGFTRSFRFINVIIIVTCELQWTHYHFPVHLCMMDSFNRIYNYYDFF